MEQFIPRNKTFLDSTRLPAPHLQLLILTICTYKCFIIIAIIIIICYTVECLARCSSALPRLLAHTVGQTSESDASSIYNIHSRGVGLNKWRWLISSWTLTCWQQCEIMLFVIILSLITLQGGCIHIWGEVDNFYATWLSIHYWDYKPNLVQSH